MKLTKFFKVTVNAKTKKECKDQFKLMKSACDTEFEEIQGLSVNLITGETAIETEGCFD